MFKVCRLVFCHEIQNLFTNCFGSLVNNKALRTLLLGAVHLHVSLSLDICLINLDVFLSHFRRLVSDNQYRKVEMDISPIICSCQIIIPNVCSVIKSVQTNQIQWISRLSPLPWENTGIYR